MNAQTVLNELPFLAAAPQTVVDAFAAQTMRANIPAGTVVFTEGDACESIAILVSGSVRVFKIGLTGREITLYRFAQGESCILTANCVLSERQFPALARVEDNAVAYIVPAAVFRAWVNTQAFWRTYVFGLLSQRLATVMAIVDEVAFRRMDERLSEFLLKRAEASGPVLRLTHQDIAAELGTSREVVSRILEDFAAAGSIKTARGVIEVLALGSR